MDYSDAEYYDYREHENFSYNFSYDDYLSICEKEDVRSFARVFLPIVYGLSIVVGLAGNALVVTVYAYFKHPRTMMDTFMVHLAMADLLLLLTLPFWAADAVQGWELGEALCKLVTALYTINFTCSMLLLACISLDRYLLLTSGQREGYLRHVFRRNHSNKLCILVWIIGLLLGVPDLVLSSIKEHPNRKLCIAMYSSNIALQAKVSMEVLEVLLGFLVPLLIMLYCYSHVVRKLLELPSGTTGKRWATIRMLLTVVGVFMVTQLPYNIVKFYRVLDMIHIFVIHCETSKALDRASQVTECLALTHCCLNPVLYAFVGLSFRQYVLKFAKNFGQKRKAEQRCKEHELEISHSTNSHSQMTSIISL